MVSFIYLFKYFSPFFILLVLMPLAVRYMRMSCDANIYSYYLYHPKKKIQLGSPTLPPRAPVPSLMAPDGGRPGPFIFYFL